MNIYINKDIKNNSNYFSPEFIKLDSETNQKKNANLNPDLKTNEKTVFDDIDLINISENILNLSLKNRINRLDVFSFLNNEQVAEIGKFLKELSSRGIIGWEYYEINGEYRKVFIENTIGDTSLYGKKPVQFESSCFCL
ncbi:hypothetical protein KA977_00110 [Candidatus Dependentiae bacterium]|nr:hypothetical protein [Candidatus Dependentiae bacterium]